MRLAFFDDYRLGVLKGDRVVDVTAAVGPRAEGLPVDLAAEGMMETVIARFGELRPKLEAIADREAGVPRAQVRFRPPLPRPHTVLCAFSNYRDRADADSAPRSPVDFFHKNATSVIGDGETVELPDIPEAKVFQPEPELAYLIGRRAKNVPASQALDYVFGYTLLVDISARDIPNRRTTFFHKSLDTWAPLGPAITTKDEIADPHALQVRLWLNGDKKQDYSTSLMAHNIPAQIEWLTTYLTLVPGDVISCGVHHVGLSPINDGDAVELDGENLERLTFKVRSYGPRKDYHWRPPGVRD